LFAPDAFLDEAFHAVVYSLLDHLASCLRRRLWFAAAPVRTARVLVALRCAAFAATAEGCSCSQLVFAAQA
jgi:hypothetical protein